jgi:short subunit dehydrogenase-like uncharacterized protein
MEVYTKVPQSLFYLLKFQFAFNWLLRKEFFRNYVKKRINKKPAGPSDEQREKAFSIVWGKVWNANGNEVTSYIKTADGYTLTMHSCLIIAKKILEGNLKTGYQTPALAYGEDLVKEIPGTIASS